MVRPRRRWVFFFFLWVIGGVIMLLETKGKRKNRERKRCGSDTKKNFTIIFV
jgi:hypothetical protein